MQEYLLSLCREYLDLCNLMRSSQHDGAEYRELSSQRSQVHDELIRLLGDEYARPFDMQQHCRDLLRDA